MNATLEDLSIPEDVYIPILQFCDLSALWAFGVASRGTSKLVFEGIETAEG